MQNADSAPQPRRFPPLVPQAELDRQEPLPDRPPLLRLILGPGARAGQ